MVIQLPATQVDCRNRVGHRQKLSPSPSVAMEDYQLKTAHGLINVLSNSGSQSQM